MVGLNGLIGLVGYGLLEWGNSVNPTDLNPTNLSNLSNLSNPTNPTNLSNLSNPINFSSYFLSRYAR